MKCLVSRVIRQYGPNPTSDLLGVDYFVDVPADTEFPKRIGPLELFVRFVGVNGIRGRVRVVVSYLNPDGSDRQVMFRKVYPLPTVVAAGDVILARGFKLVDLDVPGEGTYAVRVARRVRRPWEAKAGRRVLGADYFQVRRGP
jgi:hypothetical protein